MRVRVRVQVRVRVRESTSESKSKSKLREHKSESKSMSGEEEVGFRKRREKESEGGDEERRMRKEKKKREKQLLTQQLSHNNKSSALSTALKVLGLLALIPLVLSVPWMLSWSGQYMKDRIVSHQNPPFFFCFLSFPFPSFHLLTFSLAPSLCCTMYGGSTWFSSQQFSSTSRERPSL